MKKLACFLLVAVVFVLTSSRSARAIIVGFEDFDGGAINLSSTANVFDFNAGGGTGGDVFGRVSGQLGGTGMPFDVGDDTVADVSGAQTGAPFPADTRGIAGRNSTAFFAMNDSDGDIDGSGNSLNNAVWTFDITSALSISSITIDIAALGDFEASSSDGFTIEARIDSNPYAVIFQGITDEAASKTYRPMDSGTIPTDSNDPLELFIDGTATGTFLDKSDATTGKFDTYVSTLLAGQSGSTLDIQISWAGSPSGSEPMGFDNITVNAVPEASAFLFGGLATAVAGLGYARRRRS